MKYSNPDDISVGITSPLNSIINASGEVFMLVGAAHDGNGPAISAISLSVVPTTYTPPTVAWTTNEPSTSWLLWGTTTDTTGTPVYGSDTLVTSHSVLWNESLTVGTTYYYRVRSTDALGNTSTSAVLTYVPVMPPPAPVMSDETTFTGLNDTNPVWVALDSSSVTSPDGHGVEYQFSLNGQLSAWQSSTTWTLQLYTGAYSVAVRARDVVHPAALSAWSAADTFVVDNADPPVYGSCPFVFVWDGTKLSFEADISTTGKLAEKTSTGYSRPDPRDRYVLTTEPELKNGAVELRLVEERFEIDYSDEMTLFAMDLPEGVDVYAEKGVRGGRGAVPPAGLHTVTDLQTPPTIRTDTGEDVTASLSAVDGGWIVLNDDREDFEYKTLEFDLGPDVVNAPQVKVVMHAQTDRPVTPEGVALQRTFGATTILEVEGTDGTWRRVPAAEATLPNAMEFPRSYVFEIGRAMHDTTGKVRFTFLFKTYIDMFGVDTSADLPIAVTEMPLESAQLSYHGIDERFEDGPTAEFTYGDPVDTFLFPPGNYTRYGDVAPLLTAADDKFVVWGPGDEMALRFTATEPASADTHREYVLFSETYYKSVKSDTPMTVDPLPFAAMSNFPYPASEHYPDDAEHDEYLAQWNTRVPTPGEMPAPAEAVAASSEWRVYHYVTAAQSEDQFSVDSDYAVVWASKTDGTVASVQAAAGWESQSVEGLKPTPSAPGTAVPAATIDAMDTDDGAYWRTNLAATDATWNWQVVRFDLGATARLNTKGISLTWNGHGEPTTGYLTAVFVWNPVTFGWVQVKSTQMTADTNVVKDSYAPDSSFCISCHDGTAPTGVVFPAGTKNVGLTWAAVNGDYHGGQAGDGYGTAGLKVPYTRGQPAIQCAVCHDTHGNASIYHFPAGINGTTLAPVTTGSGVLSVCSSCHAGTPNDWHPECLGCHNDPEGHDTPGLDFTAGYDCVECHKHNTNWVHPNDGPSCHCAPGGQSWRSF